MKNKVLPLIHIILIILIIIIVIIIEEKRKIKMLIKVQDNIKIEQIKM